MGRLIMMSYESMNEIARFMGEYPVLDDAPKYKPAKKPKKKRKIKSWECYIKWYINRMPYHVAIG